MKLLTCLVLIVSVLGKYISGRQARLQFAWLGNVVRMIPCLAQQPGGLILPVVGFRGLLVLVAAMTCVCAGRGGFELRLRLVCACGPENGSALRLVWAGLGSRHSLVALVC